MTVFQPQKPAFLRVFYFPVPMLKPADTLGSSIPPSKKRRWKYKWRFASFDTSQWPSAVRLNENDRVFSDSVAVIFLEDPLNNARKKK